MQIKSIVAAWLLALLPCVAVASQSGDADPDLQQITAQQREIRAGITAGTPAFAYLDDNRRRYVLLAQDRLFELVGERQAITELKVNDQLRVFNQLKRIEALLVNADADGNLVCERTAIAGTRRQQLACMKKSDRERKADSTRDALQIRPACTTSECVGG